MASIHQVHVLLFFINFEVFFMDLFLVLKIGPFCFFLVMSAWTGFFDPSPGLTLISIFDSSGSCDPLAFHLDFAIGSLWKEVFFMPFLGLFVLNSFFGAFFIAI
jgi:hypothetical protein